MNYNLRLDTVSTLLPSIFLRHILHLKFAVMFPFCIPEPSRRVICEVEPLVDGCLSPVPNRGETVTLSPAELE